MMVFQTIEVFKCLRVIEEVEKVILRPPTIPIAMTEFIIVVTMVEVGIGLKRPSTLPLSIMEFIILVKMSEVDLGLKIPDPLPV